MSYYGDMWSFLDNPDPNKNKPVQERFLHKLKQRKKIISGEIRQLSLELKSLQELNKEFHNQKENIGRVKNSIQDFEKELVLIERDLKKVV